MIRSLVDELDEHLLIPGDHHELTHEVQGESLEIRYRERRYLVPKEEVIVLPITNSSAENLATWVGRTLRSRMAEAWPDLSIGMLEVAVEETPGQRGIYTATEDTSA